MSMQIKDFWVLGSWLLPTASLLQDLYPQKVDTVFAAAGLNRKQINGSERVGMEKVNRLLDAVLEIRQDAGFLLQVAEHTGPVTFQSLGMAALVAQTGQEVFSLLSRYQHLISNACHLELKESSGFLEVSMMPHLLDDGAPVLGTQARLIFVASIARLLSGLSGGLIKPAKVCLRHLPEGQADILKPWFGCDELKQASFDALFFPVEMMRHTLPMANPELAQMNQVLLSRYLQQDPSLINQVESELLKHEPFYLVPASQMASHFCLSLRSFQRRLSESGTSYKSLLDRVRKEKSMELIKRQDVSVSEVAYLMGFSSVSNFSSAFKRWTGVSPVNFRQPKA